jgi:hypothetical protein
MNDAVGTAQVDYLQEICGKITQFEDKVPWLYLDSNKPGLVTVGVGKMLPNPIAAAVLPFQVQGRLATYAEVEADFARVHAMEPDHLPTYYLAATSIKLLDADIEVLLYSVVADVDRQLRAMFPHYGDWPKGAKLATIDMLFNLGPSHFKVYSHLISSLNEENWEQASKECGRNVHDAAFAARNYWTLCSFMDADRAARAAAVIHHGAA